MVLTTLLVTPLRTNLYFLSVRSKDSLAGRVSLWKPSPSYLHSCFINNCPIHGKGMLLSSHCFGIDLLSFQYKMLSYP